MNDGITINELKKYFDPFIFENLSLPTVTQIKYRRIIIVFWDISGFSDACNNLVKDQEAIIAFLKEYFSLASQIIGSHAGVLDKFMGDGIMGYFGYPIENEEHANAAIQAALELHNEFEEVKNRYQERWHKHYGKKIKINVKCGIHSGFAFCGLIAAGARNQITVIGDDVNLASRLEGCAHDNQILISPDLKNMVEDNYEFEEIYLKPQDRMKSFNHIEIVYSVSEYKTRIPFGQQKAILHPSSSMPLHHILNRKELNNFPFNYYTYPLSDKYHELLQIQSISIIKVADYVFEINLTIKGTIKKGFINFLVKDQNGEEDWYPDSKTFDVSNYLGRLEMNKESYSDRSLIDLTKIVREKWTMYVFIFEDTSGNTSGTRKVVAGVQLDFPI